MQSCLAAGFGSINAIYTENNALQNSEFVDSILFVLSIKMANNMSNLGKRRNIIIGFLKHNIWYLMTRSSG